MKRYLLGIAAAVFAAFIYLAYPVYQFAAHRGAAPLPPWGWESLEDDAPEEQRVVNGEYTAAGDAALRAMATYRAEHGLPSLSAAVAREGQVVWSGSTGFRDIGERLPATPDTLYRIGSTSKALTATALARLVERGEIDLNSPVGTYSSSARNPLWEKITARQLASHTAGTPHYGENGDFIGLYHGTALRRHYDDVRDALSVFDESPLLFEPGTDFHYSSLGTVLLGAAMSDAAGISYRDLMRREVFEPAGMDNTFVDGDGDAPADSLATFYFPEGERFRPWRPVDLSHRLPGGGFIATPTDLVKAGALFLDDRVLSDATRTTFWTPQTLVDGTVNEQNYALGWRWREFEFEGYDPVRNANHGGVSRGSQCWLLVYPDYDMAMAFCSNVKTDEFGTFADFYEPFFRAFTEPSRS